MHPSTLNYRTKTQDRCVEQRHENPRRGGLVPSPFATFLRGQRAQAIQAET